MKQTSLRLRLLLVWAIFIAITLQLAGVGLRVLFERSIARRTQTELEADLRQLRRGMEIGPGGEIIIAREPTDPQFDIVLGGRYWQVMENDVAVVRSRSLGEATLSMARWRDSITPDGPTWLVGPDRERLFAVVRHYRPQLSEGAPDRELVIVTGVDAAEISEDTDKFAADLWKSLFTLAALLLMGAWAHVTIGLSPLKSLSEKVAAVRSGKSRRLDGDYPDEVMPLVAETNALLDAQEADLQQARQRAGDLAHGLKTPLAIMAASARTLRRRGIDDTAADVERQIEVMRRHVDRELARARARGASRPGLAPIDLVAPLAELVGVIESLPRQRHLTWELDIPDELLVPFDIDDFNNLAGNLIENAGKWAASRVHVALAGADGHWRLSVSDDGPGIAEDHMERVLRRGERADTSVSGSGLGLAIVSDIVQLYRGQLSLQKSDLGGLCAQITVPNKAGPP